MTVTIDHLTPVEKTLLLITLTGGALDARTKRPPLGDRSAATAFDRLGPGADIVKLPEQQQASARGAQQDAEPARRRVHRRAPECGGRGAGLWAGNRMHRIAPSATVDWYDIDLDNVIALRGQPVPSWIARISSRRRSPTRPPAAFRGRPAIVVADGVLGFRPKPTTGRSWAR